jgi:hypothetical protein
LAAPKTAAQPDKYQEFNSPDIFIKIIATVKNYCEPVELKFTDKRN